MTTWAVIGSNCFTGSHIVDALLDRGETVIGISRSPQPNPIFLPYATTDAGTFEFFQHHLVDGLDGLIATLDDARPEFVVNVAALSEVVLSNHRPAEYYRVNTQAVVELCDALRQRDYMTSYVHISSAEIFGTCGQRVTESDPFFPSTPYAVSKAAADMHLETMRRNFEFPAIIIRSTNVYGRHQQLFKIIPRTAIRVNQGEIIELHGGGQSRKSFVHIRDVVNGLLLAVERGTPETYHFSVESDKTVADVVRLVCELKGASFEESTRAVGERLGQDQAYRLDCTRAREELGWRPQVEFTDGVRETVTWIDDCWDIVKTESHDYQHRI